MGLRGLFIAGLSQFAFACDDGEVSSKLTMCTPGDNDCIDRWYCLPTNEFASTCDTLGDVVGWSGSWTTENIFWRIGQDYLPDGLDCPYGKCPEVTFYTDPYCGGKPIDYADANSEGRFQAVLDDTWFTFTAPQPVMSVRTTVHFPGSSKGGDKIGLKLVLFPQYDMDRDLGTSDEITCEDWDWKPNLNFPSEWPDTCASPIDRVYCLERDPWAYDDQVDDWVQQFNWDPSWSPFDFAGQIGPDSTAYKFKGVYPMGSVIADFYTSSWTSNEPCRDLDQGIDNAIVGPKQGTCIITKLYEDTDCQSNGWDVVTPFTFGCGCVDRCDQSDWVPTQNCDLGSWGDGSPKCTNSGGEGSGFCVDAYENAPVAWPQAIRCAWTRILTQDDPYCAYLYSSEGMAKTANASSSAAVV